MTTAQPALKRRLWAACAVVATTLWASFGVPPLASAAADYRIDHIDTGDLGIVRVNYSADARFAAIFDGNSSHHLDLTTGVKTSLTLKFASLVDANYAYVFDSTTVRRESIVNGTIDTFSMPTSTLGELRSVAASSADGRLLLLETLFYVDMKAVNRHLLYDTVNRAFVALPSPGLDPGGRSTSEALMSPDGDRFIFRVSTSQFGYEYASLTRSTNTFRSISGLPNEEEWRSSGNLQWVVFRSSDASLYGQGSPLRALYRRNVATGAVTRVHLDARSQDIRSYTVMDDGRVLASVRSIDASGAERLQLFVWSSSEPLSRQLTQSTAGALANGSIDLQLANVSVGADGQSYRIAFSSYATNLVPGLAGTRHRVFVATIPSADPNAPQPSPRLPDRRTLPPATRPVPRGQAALVGPQIPSDLVDKAAFIGNFTSHAVVSVGARSYHFDLTTRAFVELGIEPSFVGTDFALSIDAGGFYRQTVSTGAIDRFEPRFPIGNGLNPTRWNIARFNGTDATGRYVLFTADSDRGTSRPFLYDTATRDHVPWAGDGVALDPVSENAGSGAEGTSITSDGRTLVTIERTRDRAVLWDLASGSHTDLDPPPQDAGYRHVISPDGMWDVFVSAEDILGDGYEGPRLFRRNLSTGVVDVIPTDPNSVVDMLVRSGGRVFLMDSAAGPSLTARRILVWDGETTEMTPIRAGSDGPTADESIVAMHVDDAGRNVTFTTYNAGQPNLGGSRLFRAVLGASLTEQSTFQPATPDGGARLADTRTGTPGAKLDPDAALCMAAVGADPDDFIAVNVTPVQATARGYATVHSSDDPAGATSSVNYSPGSVDPNLAVVKVGGDGRICITNGPIARTHVVVDQLTTIAAGTMRPPSADGAERLADTRKGLGGGVIQTGATRCVATVDAMPGDVVGVNITPLQATARGYGTTHSSDDPAGATSNVNFEVGSIDPNFSLVRVGSDGMICFTNSDQGNVHLLLDQLVTAHGERFDTPSDDGAVRVLDTRSGSNRLGPNERVCVAAVNALPGDYIGVNTTPLQATGRGFGTVHSSDDPVGKTSNVNFDVGSVDPNFSFVQVGSDGTFCVTNSAAASIHLLIDELVVAL
jgi:hypothetical protein